MVHSAIYISSYWYKPSVKTSGNYAPPKTIIQTIVQSIENRFMNDFGL
jgi:hypothetical protein